MDKSENYDGFELLEQSLRKVSVEKESEDEKQKKELPGKVPKKEKKRGRSEQEEGGGSQGFLKVTVYLTVREHAMLKIASFLSRKTVSSIVREDILERVNGVESLLSGSGGFDLESIREKYDKVYKVEKQ